MDEAMEEIRKLSVEGYRLKENRNSDPKKIIDEGELERHWLKAGTCRQFCPREEYS